MSDEESYEYEYDEEESDDPMDNNDDDDNEEDEEFEYTDDEEEVDDIGVALENAYYNAKGLRDDAEREQDLSDSAIQEAVDAFEGVIDMENQSMMKAAGQDEGDNASEDARYFGPWSFKGLKQLVKLYLRNGNHERASITYTRLLDCISSPRSEGVSPNAIEKGVNAMLERIASLFQGASPVTSSSNDTMNHHQLARNVYDSTLTLFHPRNGHCPNERLWTKTNLKYGQLLYEMNEAPKLQKVIKDLLKTIHNPHNESSENITSTSSTNNTSSFSTTLMEIYALQIQLYSKQKDHKKLRTILNKAMKVQGGIPHPRTLALIQELGGKMHMTAREFDLARTAFFQAFKSYDEAGDVSRLRCLKYLVMASMLQASNINPFDSQEVRPYRNDPQIVAMTRLMEAFQSNEIHTFEMILKKNEGNVMDDEFIRENLSDLVRTIRTQVLQQVIRPYTRISLKAISKELNGIPIKDVESLLVCMILDGKANGRIDQVNGVLIKDVEKGASGSRGAGANGMSASDGNGTGSNGGGGVESRGSGGSNTSSTTSGVDANGNRSMDAPHLLSTGAIPPWAKNSIDLRTHSAMNQLLEELEKKTLLVATTAGNTSHKFY